MVGETPRVSFVIPAFNEERSLPSCLRAVLALKDEASMEIIVVDNNSSDQTAQVAEAWGARVVPCEVQGIAAARNEGARQARGDLLAFIDADGQVSQGWLRASLSGMSRCDVVTGWNYFREKNPLLGIYFNSYNVVFFLLQRLTTLCRKPLMSGNNLLISRDLFLRLGGFPRYVGEDVKFARILASRKISLSFSHRMIVSYSSRRFRKQGFLKTMILWVSSVFSDISEHDYFLDYSQH
jgi:glycosyltransferase involved in cell wall biosynthesis